MSEFTLEDYQNLEMRHDWWHTRVHKKPIGRGMRTAYEDFLNRLRDFERDSSPEVILELKTAVSGLIDATERQPFVKLGIRPHRYFLLSLYRVYEAATDGVQAFTRERELARDIKATVAGKGNSGVDRSKDWASPDDPGWRFGGGGRRARRFPWKR